MQEFMRSDAHGEIMWRFSRWLESLWLMRWLPGPEACGAWDGVALTGAPPRPGGDSPDWMSRDVRRARRELRGAGVAVRIGGAGTRRFQAAHDLRALRKDLLADGRALRAAVGLAPGGNVYLLAVFPDEAQARAFPAGQWMEQAGRTWGDRLWAACWRPDNEYGHWDGWRLRRERRARIP